MGGQSKCPGETITSRRESNVKISEIKHKCGPNADSICDETTLKYGDSANFAVVIYNDSPTGMMIGIVDILYYYILKNISGEYTMPIYLFIITI